MTAIVSTNRICSVILLIVFAFIASTPLFRLSRWYSRCSWRRRGGLLHCQLLEVLRRDVIRRHHKGAVYRSTHLLPTRLGLFDLDFGHAHDARIEPQPGEELAERVVRAGHFDLNGLGGVELSGSRLHVHEPFQLKLLL